MIVRSRQLTCTISCCLFTGRTFRTSLSRNLVTGGEGSSKATRLRVTRKKLSELPKTYILPDGSSASPLGHWDGGTLEREAMITSISDNGPVGERESDGSTKPDVTPKQVRKRRVKALHAIEYNATEPAGDNAQAPMRETRLNAEKARKPRRPKASTMSADDTTQLGETRVLTYPSSGETSEGSVRRKSKRVISDNTIGVYPQGLDPQEGGNAAVNTSTPPRNRLSSEIRDNLARFPHCILLTRVGQFYESYFDQAIEVSHLLGIKLAIRRWDGQRIPMCGFPLMHLDKYLKMLVQQNNRFVAMCEEFPRYSALGVKEFDRRVSRVITPGTLIDESFLNQYENNYLLALGLLRSRPNCRDLSSPSHEDSVGLAWIDVSTGEFFSKSSSYEDLRDELARIAPREVVIDRSLSLEDTHPIRQALCEEEYFVSYIDASSQRADGNGIESASADCRERDLGQKCGEVDYTSVELAPPSLSEDSAATDNLTDLVNDIPPPIQTMFTPHEASAIELLTTFLRANLLEHMPILSPPNREVIEGRMQIDAHTIKALEIRESMREGGIKGSLLSVVKRTVTTSGTRLLGRWLCSPSTSIKEINARQSVVAFFHARPEFQSDILESLSTTDDAGRILQKFLLGRGDASDLLAINTTIRVWSNIQKRIHVERLMEAQERSNFDETEWASLDALMSRMTELSSLSERISRALQHDNLAREDNSIHGPVEESSTTTNQVDTNEIIWSNGPSRWAIKPEFSERLLSLHSALKTLMKRREKLEEELQRAYDAPSLTLRSSPGHGMHVHIGKAKRDQSKLRQSSRFVGIAESGTTACFFDQEWSKLGNDILETTLAINNAEKDAFELLREEVNSHAVHIRRNARILDELDVTLSFARLAVEMSFTRPTLDDQTSYNVVNGRHPTVELGLLVSGRVYTPNSVSISPTSRLHILTGPNMAGKSTLLRQTALIAILAQTGSFVPADHAAIGIVDKLFSRVGAKDDLFHDRSTFMVEMLETAEILRRATPKSLVIMDEVGRGTTVQDGLAIAFATVHHLLSISKCRALFATHFHELADMLGYSSTTQTGQGIFNDVAFYCTNIDEMDDGNFAYSYRMQPGVNRDSHGLKVAQLAGMPPATITVAREALSWLKSRPVDESQGMALGAVGQLLAAQSRA